MNVKSLLGKDAIILACLSAYLYFIVWIEIKSKSIVYGIPAGIMSFGHDEIYSVSIPFIVIAVLLTLLLYIFNKIDDSDFKINKMISFLFKCVVLPISFFFLFRNYGASIFISTLAACFFGFFMLVMSLFGLIFIAKDKRDSLKKVKVFPFNESGDFSIFDLILIIFSLILVPLLIFFGNAKEYSKKVDYDTFYKNGYYAIVDYSSDVLIAKKIKKGRLGEGFCLFKIESLEKVEIRKKNIRSLTE